MPTSAWRRWATSCAAGPNRLATRCATRRCSTFLAFLVVLGIGSRDLISQGVPAVGQLPQWTGVHAMLASFGSAWRYTGLGSSTAGPPLLVLTSGLSTVLLGSIGLARTVAVVGAFPVGAIGAYRLARAQRATLGPALVTAIAYAANPIARNAVASGRFGPLTFFALAPFLATAVGARRPLRPRRRRPTVRRARALSRSGRRPLLGLVALTAIATACYPLAAPLVVAAALAFVAGSLLYAGPARVRAEPGRGRAGGCRDARAAVPVVVVGQGRLHGSGGVRDRVPPEPRARRRAALPHRPVRWRHPRLGSLRARGVRVAGRGRTARSRGRRGRGCSPPRVSRWRTSRNAWRRATRSPRRKAPSRSPRSGLRSPPGSASARSSTSCATSVSVGARSQRCSPSPASCSSSLGFAADALDGRWHAPSDDWQHELAFTSDQLYQGTFRVLWLGRSGVLPLDPFEYDDQLAYTLTSNGPGDVRELLRAPERGADAVVHDAIALTTQRRTNRMGRLLAPMGVRYVAVTRTNGPGGESDPPPAGLESSLADQLDLVRLHAPAGLVLYENAVWVPERAAVTGAAASSVPIGPVDPSRSALRTDLHAAAVPLGDAPVPKGTALLGQAHDSEWKASGGGATLPHLEAFGWSNAFRVPSSERVSLKFDGQSTHDLLLVAAAVPWVLLLVLWWAGRRRARARRREEAAARRAPSGSNVRTAGPAACSTTSSSRTTSGAACEHAPGSWELPVADRAVRRRARRRRRLPRPDRARGVRRACCVGRDRGHPGADRPACRLAVHRLVLRRGIVEGRGPCRRDGRRGQPVDTAGRRQP